MNYFKCKLWIRIILINVCCCCVGCICDSQSVNIKDIAINNVSLECVLNQCTHNKNTWLTTTAININNQSKQREVETTLLEMEPEQNSEDIDWINWQQKTQIQTQNQIQIETETETQTVEKSRGKRKKKKKKKGKRKRVKPKRKRGKRKKHKQQLTQPANLLFATLQQLPEPLVKPHTHYHQYKPPAKKIKPTQPPFKHINLLLHKSQLLKKKKQKYLSHLGSVFYPLVKFVTFFTVLNPFTLAVFFFMLISPIVFGLLGFAAISLVLRPVLQLLFAFKRRIARIPTRSRYYKHRKQPRPITIHKHYYQQPPMRQHKRRPYVKLPLRHVHSRLDINAPQFELLPPAFSLNEFNPILPEISRKFQQQLPNQMLTTIFNFNKTQEI